MFKDALTIVKTLKERGHVAVLAGGCVRDALLGVAAHDLDLATSALPEEVEKAFARTLALGKDFGTIGVVLEGQTFEVTTFRGEGPYLDGRHPSEVWFTNMEEDARRRDFTVNALFYDPLTDELIDFVGGRQDLADKILRTVGAAEARFGEDHLRMLRGIRFVGQLGFTLDEEALRATRLLKHKLAAVSVERIFTETRKLLGSGHLHLALEVLLKSELHEIFWPELLDLTLPQVKSLPPFINWENVYAGLSLILRQDPRPRLQAWKVSRESQRRVQLQLDAIHTLRDGKSSRADRVRALGGDVYAEVLALCGLVLPSTQAEAFVNEYLRVAGADGKLPKPWVTGADLIEAGIPAGEKMGQIIKRIYDAQLEARIESREDALKMVGKF